MCYTTLMTANARIILELIERRGLDKQIKIIIGSSIRKNLRNQEEENEFTGRKVRA